MAHNEAATIASALRSLLAQEVECATVESIVVVSSGSTDRTDEIVRQLAGEDDRIVLVTEVDRRGKVHADNVFFERYPGFDYYSLCNADVILAPGALQALLAPLSDPTVGITGCRVVPRIRSRDERGFIEFANHVLWEVHHVVVSEQPKMGEAVAFRPLVDQIPETMIADEAYLEATARRRGLRVVYVPAAIVSSGVPLALGEYLSVRRRNTFAHTVLQRESGHEVATLSAAPIVRALGGLVLERFGRHYGAGSNGRRRHLRQDLRESFWLLGVVLLEVLARTAASIEAKVAPHRHRHWRMARSARERDAQNDQSTGRGPRGLP